MRSLASAPIHGAKARVALRRALLVALVVLFGDSWVFAEAVDVPVELQVNLVARVAAYDRNLQERAQGRVLVWILKAQGDLDSERVAAELEAAFKKVPSIAGLPATVRIVDYVSAEKLLERCKRDVPSVLYLSAGLSRQVSAIARELDGTALLTVAAVPRYVDAGSIVLGVESRSGKPGLVVHLERARHHHVAFKPELLKLARVIR